MRMLVPQHFQAELANRLPEFELIPYDAEGNIAADASGAEVFFRWWLSQERGDEILRQYPALKWIHTGSTGVDHILTPQFFRKPYALTNSAGVHAPSIAEWVVMTMLSITKDFPRMLAQQRDHVWQSVQRPELRGSTVLFLGAGHIARAIAVRLAPFGVSSIAARRSVSGSDPHPFDRVIGPMEADELLPAADFLILALPLTPHTREILHRERIERLGRECMVINVSRGEVIDEEALLDALRSNAIGGAILDVFREEPLPPASPFWDLENVYILPHTTWRSPEVRQRQIELFTENAGRYRRAEPMLNLVDVSAGY